MRDRVFTFVILAAAAGFISIALLPVGNKTVPLPVTIASWILVGAGVVLMGKRK